MKKKTPSTKSAVKTTPRGPKTTVSRLRDVVPEPERIPLPVSLRAEHRQQSVVFMGGGAGDAWMATALFSMLADPARARPVLAAKAQDVRVLSLAAEVLRESGCDASGVVVREPTAELVKSADVVVTMAGSFRRELLASTPHHRREHWLVPEALGANAVERARHVRDLIRSRVAMLVMMEGWGRTNISRETARVTRPALTVEVLASL